MGGCLAAMICAICDCGLQMQMLLDTCFGLWYDFYAGEYHDDGNKNGECQKDD